MTSVLLESSLRAIALAAVVALTLRILRVRSSAVRHASWRVVLVAMLVMPVWSAVMPTFEPPDVPMPAIQLPEAMLRTVIVPETFVPAAAPGRAAVPAAPSGAEQSPHLPPAEAAPYIRMAVPGPNPWALALAGVYLLGLAVSLGRLFIGWRAMRRVALASRLSSDSSYGPVYESLVVSTPLTLGIFRPRVVVPSIWTTWTDETRSAVLAHERAHTRRRDPLVSLIAHVNRSIFWFHPLAWWLERTIAATAEEACDDAGVRAVGESQRYAEVLVAMASAVGQQGGRVAWQGLGVNGNGMLGERIDRVLRGEVSIATSWWQRWGVGVACGIAGVLAVACQRQTALQADPILTQKIAEDAANWDARLQQERATALTTDAEAAAAEAKLVANPEDLPTRAALLDFYQDTLLRSNPERWKQARRPHGLWLIEHHPESDMTWRYAHFYAHGDKDKGSDPAAYEAGKKLWLAHVSRPDVSAVVLRHAADYMRDYDSPQAEQLMERARSQRLVDPAQPNRSWTDDLAWLYASVISRAASHAQGHSYDTPYDQPVYAAAIEKKLAGSTDPELLASVVHICGELGRSGTRRVGWIALDRLAEIDPQSAIVQRVVAARPDYDRRERLAKLLNITKPPTPADLAALTAADRFWVLPQLASQAETRANEAAWAQAREYAKAALALAPQFEGTRDYASSTYQAEMTLSLLDVRAGHPADAANHLLAASVLPVPADRTVLGGVTGPLLLVALLKDNHRDAVVTFLEREAAGGAADQKRLSESAQQIRKGQMPEWYQRAMTSSRR